MTVAPSSSSLSIADAHEKIRDSIRQGLEDRRPHEAVWASNLAFAAGQHDAVWDRLTRQLVTDPSLGDTEPYTADVITEQRAAALGELQSDDDRPQVLLAVEDESAEEVTEHVNQACQFGWEQEWDAQEALREMRLMVIDLGTAAIRCRRDGSKGSPFMREVPHDGRKPIIDEDEQRAFVASMHERRQPANLRTINEGMTVWEAGSPFNLIVPPGCKRESKFPWECWVQPAPLDEVRDTYGAAAARLTEDRDIASDLGLNATDQRMVGHSPSEGNAGRSYLRDHVWLYSFYQRPGVKHPKGRVITLAGSQMLVMDEQPELEYKTPTGEYRSGIEYFHWWRLTNKFWSRSFVEGLKDPQRMINRRKRQSMAIIDLGMPKTFAEEGSDPTGSGEPLEIVYFKPGTTQPVYHPGVGPGPWMKDDIAELREDLAHASTLSAIRLGENPSQVTTYSQLALLDDVEQRKRSSIREQHQAAIRELMIDSIWDIRKYWPDEKHLAVSGDDRVEMVAFKKSTIPDMYTCRIAHGKAKPRGQGAELQKVQDIANYSATSGQPLPVGWYADSLAAGEVVDLPGQPTDRHREVARYENHLLLNDLGLAPVAYYDPAPLHIPEHRIAQNEARLAGDQEAFQRLEDHVIEHLMVARQVAAEQAAIAPPLAGAPEPPGAPPQPGAPDGGGTPAGPMMPDQPSGGGPVPPLQPPGPAAG